MRLDPTFTGPNTRSPVVDTVVLGHVIPKGAMVWASSRSVNYDTRIYARPREFLPQRWLDDAPEELKPKQQHAGTYFPFGAGPRGE